MPLICPLPNVLLNTDAIEGAVYDPAGPILHVRSTSPEARTFRGDDATAVWEAIRRHVAEPVSLGPDMPRRFRCRMLDGPAWWDGTYYPDEDRWVSETGSVRNGKPMDVEWIDPEPVESAP